LPDEIDHMPKRSPAYPTAADVWADPRAQQYLDGINEVRSRNGLPLLRPQKSAAVQAVRKRLLVLAPHGCRPPDPGCSLWLSGRASLDLSQLSGMGIGPAVTVTNFVAHDALADNFCVVAVEFHIVGQEDFAVVAA
jgi:hypothetical protein